MWAAACQSPDDTIEQYDEDGIMWVAACQPPDDTEDTIVQENSEEQVGFHPDNGVQLDFQMGSTMSTAAFLDQLSPSLALTHAMFSPIHQKIENETEIEEVD